ncbi:sugar phosphate isomerase/epimerase [Brevibacillus sp. AG]|uniref:sugar phosphate isomerase/epimerase n=1 Tax=Brevibacillus sp. AG TaxID=3020891 RepID=UPI00232E3272|nr:sugar phosphate isomerase/epimerase [Brevibacillus sp. AG]MDC0759094.1 sugar phosphate isomerase/epimerase [Brevibacillus sp. AG]
MKNFMIGQYGGFDQAKYARDFKEGFYGIEACLFESEEDIQFLQRESQAKGFAIGVHFSLRAGQSELRDALFMDANDQTRAEAFEWIDRELAYMASLQPTYVLFHYPKPVILDDRIDWSVWRFHDSRDYVWEHAYTEAEFQYRSEQLFAWLAEKGKDFRFTPVLEFDALNRYVYETEFLEHLLQKYPTIKLCLDTGRLFLQEKIDPFFNARQVIQKYTKYAWSIHLKSMKVAADTVEFVHYPVLPECKPDEGWAPIEDYLTIIRQENPHVKIMFEHRSEQVTDEQLESCYRWVKQLLEKPHDCLSNNNSI